MTDIQFSNGTLLILQSLVLSVTRYGLDDHAVAVLYCHSADGMLVVLGIAT